MADERFKTLLKERWEVLLAEYPEIDFKLDLVRKVCEMWSIPFRKEAVMALGESPTIQEFLTTLKADWTKREFLAHYITEWELDQMRPKEKPEQLAASA
jgi:hypothetical protein